MSELYADVWRRYNKQSIIKRPRHAESTYYRPRYDRDASQIRSGDVFSFVASTLDKRHTYASIGHLNARYTLMYASRTPNTRL